VKLLHLRGARRAAGQRLFGRRQGAVQCDHQRVAAQYHRDRPGQVARALELKGAGRLGHLLRDGCFHFVHGIDP
jgi:hypothetical protein